VNPARDAALIVEVFWKVVWDFVVWGYLWVLAGDACVLEHAGPVGVVFKVMCVEGLIRRV
jgi:hypothetical protein